jgi:hypothetical protein
MLSNTIASQARSASAPARARSIDGDMPRCAASGIARSARRQRGARFSSPSRHIRSGWSTGRSGFSVRAKPTTQSLAPASRAAPINPWE